MPNDHESSPLENPITVLRKQLEAHIRECTAQQRRVLWGLIAIIGWLVSHDPLILGHLKP